MLARLAALDAVGAPAASYPANLGTAVEMSMTLQDVHGSAGRGGPHRRYARVVSAAGRITTALGLVIEIAEAELADQEGWPASDPPHTCRYRPSRRLATTDLGRPLDRRPGWKGRPWFDPADIENGSAELVDRARSG